MNPLKGLDSMACCKAMTCKFVASLIAAENSMVMARSCMLYILGISKLFLPTTYNH